MLRRFIVPLALLGAGCDAGPLYRACDGGDCMDVVNTRDVRVTPLDVPPLDGTDLRNLLVGVEIDPASPTITVRGTPVPFTLRAIGRFQDGRREPVSLGRWRAANDSVGGIDELTGRFTANGLVAGSTRITLQIARDNAPALVAETTLTVRFERETFATGTPESVRDRFTTLGEDPGRRATLRYPLPEAVMPQNVAPPEVQWDGGSASTVYRVELSKTDVRAVGYLTHTGADFRFAWTVDALSWRALAETRPDEAVSVRVDLADARGAVRGEPARVRLARGSLAGAVYYWDLRAGKILRILDAPTRREDFLPSPPRRSSDNSRCVACHAISRDGRYMAAELWEGQGPSTVFDLTSNLSTDPAPTRFPVDRASWVYATFNQDSTRLVANLRGGLFFVDPATGMQVAPRAGRLPADNAVQPNWSPDGRAIAVVANVQGPGPTAFESSNLATLPVTGPDAVGDASLILRGSSLSSQPEGGSAIAYPSWTPDGRWLAFQHGPFSESDREVMGSTARRRVPGAVYLMNPAGGTPLRMTNATFDGVDHDAYFPNFSPFVQGGFYWVVFFSRRDYGNAIAGTRGSGRRQLWVSAVTTNPQPGTDPSSVPYWLPGQDVRSDNVSGFWAPQPCRPRGASCQVSSECCAGSCGPGPNGALVCNPPPPEAQCRREGERCGATGDCCEGLECAANVCLRPPG
ncbi:MAG: hypothetical protein U0325_16755 [Polyangiales bacterium]